MFKVNDEEGAKLINTYGTKTIKGKSYYRIGENEYIAAGNIDGTLSSWSVILTFTTNMATATTTWSARRTNKIATYGSADNINGAKYYRVVSVNTSEI